MIMKMNIFLKKNLLDHEDFNVVMLFVLFYDHFEQSY